jgi:hypothetical protein
MFVETRDESRQFFFHVWQKMTQHHQLEPLESIVAQIIREHPEYHPVLAQPEQALDRDFLPEDGATNPFLHMGLHVALQEQLRSDRPQGLLELYRRLLAAMSDVHRAEHVIMECLAQSLWQAGRSGALPDEREYLDCVRKRIA